jgi:MFS family permease
MGASKDAKDRHRRSDERPGSRVGVRRIIAMEIVSGIGDGVFWVAFMVLLFRLGAGASGVALAVVVRLGPRALLGVPAGVIADRFDRRRLLVDLDATRSLCMLVLALLASNGSGQAPLLFVVLVAYVLAAPYRPALTAGLPHVAGESGLSTANARISTVRQVMTFVGPLLGAAVAKWTTIETAFVVNAVTFAIAAVLMYSVPALSTSTTAARRSVVEQRRGPSLRATPGLVVVGSLVAVMYAIRGSELVLYTLVAADRLGLGSAGVGLLTGAVGLGALAVMPLAPRLADSNRPDLMLILSLALTAVPLAALGVIRSPVVGSLALVVVGAGVVVFEVVSVVLLLRLADPSMLGRVFGLVGSLSNGGKLVGAMTAPLLVASVGVGGALVASGALAAAAALLSVGPLRRLRVSTAAEQARVRPIADVLASLPLFEGASPTVLQRLASLVREEECPAGTVVIEQGAIADDLFVVRAGEFEATVGDVRVNELGRNDWFGEIGLLQGRPRTATVTARTAGVVWRVPGAAFLDALNDGASAPTALLDEMSRRLQRI